MSRILLVFLALISHWRRRPGNFAALIAGLAAAGALWSGVSALNGEARRSYAEAATLFSGGGLRSVEAAYGGLFSQEDFAALRRAGWKVSPVLEGTLRIGGAAYRLLGVDPVSLPADARLARAGEGGDLAGFLAPPGIAIVAPTTARRLAGVTRTDRGDPLPPLRLGPETPAATLIVDIGVAQMLLAQHGMVSRLLLAQGGDIGAPALETLAGGRLKLGGADETTDLARLTDAFHLNLTAFGFLAFLTGLFIVHAAHGLAFEQRLPMLRTLRALGVETRDLAGAMALELAALALLAGSVGLVGGWFVASALLPDVASSLENLYGARIAPALSFEPLWFASGLAMTFAGALAAMGDGLWKTLRLPPLQIGQIQASAGAEARRVRWQAPAAVVALAVAGAAFTFGDSLASGFAVIGLLLLAGILALPPLLAAALRIIGLRARGVVAEWFFADNRREAPGLSLALMALLLALSANIGVGAMVEGFRKTFVDWLDERLVAEVYFEARDEAAAARILACLRARPEIAAILPLWRAQSRLGGAPAEITGAPPHDTFRKHFPPLALEDGGWAKVEAGEAALVSEQLARRMGLVIGDAFEVPTPGGPWTTRVAGIYPDYGNPRGQLRIALDALTAHWPDVRRVNYMLRLPPVAAKTLVGELQARHGDDLARIVDQAQVKALSMSIFERTFAVTAALDTLTLAVSAIALVAALTTLGQQRLAQLAPLWAMGVDRKRLAALELARVASLALLTALAAIPLGNALAYVLVAVVNVRAFGWRLPFHVFPGQWAEVAAMAVVAAAISAAVPALRLARAQPAQLLKAFSE